MDPTGSKAGRSRPSRSARARLKVLLAAASSAAFVLFVAAALCFLFRAPDLGVEVEWSRAQRAWQVAEAAPASPLRAGDRLVKIGTVTLGFHHLLKDNVPIASRGEIFAWLDARRALFAQLSGRQVRVVVARRGQQMEVEVPVREARLSFLGRVESLHLLVATAFFLIGLVVFWKKGFEEVGLVFSATCAALTLSFATNAASMMSGVALDPSWFTAINLLNIPNPIAIAAFMLHFSLLMPEKRRFLSRLGWLPWVFYGACALLWSTLAIDVVNAVFPVLFLASLGAMIQGYVRYQDPIQRQQMRWVLAGFGFGLLPFMVLGGIPLVLTGERLVDDTIPGLFLVLIPLCMAFAIQRYRLMDVDSLFDNSLAYAGTFGVLTILDLSVIGASARLRWLESHRSAVLVSAVWLAILLYVPVRSRLQAWVRRLLKREPYDANEVSLRLSGRLLSAQDVPSAIEMTVRLIDETLHPRRVHAWLFAPEGPPRAAGPDLPPGWREEAVALTSSTQLHELFEPADLGPDRSAGVLVPIAGPSGAIGCLVLENKHSGRMYGRRDLDLLDVVSRQASLAVETIVSREAARRTEKEACEIREHVSREMHDGVGTSFSNAIMMLDLLSKEVSGDAGGRRIRGLKALLDDGLADIRAIMQTMGDEGSCLEDLAALVRTKAERLLEGTEVKLVWVEGIHARQLPLSRPVMHHLLRIVQEAVTNALKHATATEIRLQLRESDGLLTLCVSDDGRGFEPKPERGHGLENMKARCRKMGAKLGLASSPGAGTTVSVTIPISTDG